MESKKFEENNNCSFTHNRTSFINNIKNKITDRSNMSTLNNSNQKINKQIKHIALNANNKNINSFDNDFINKLQKENERLKKLIISYENTNVKNFIKKSTNNLKKRNYLINDKIKRISERAKRSLDKKNSNPKDSSILMNSYIMKKSQNKNNINNKSTLLFLMKQNNSNNQNINYTDYSLINDTSLIIPKKKFSEIQKNNNKTFNTISTSKTNMHNDKNIYRKNTTNVNSLCGGINRINSISNKRMFNKLKVKCREYILNNKKNNQFSRSKEKNIHKITPKSIIQNNGSFFTQSNNNNNHIKNKNKLRSFKILEIDNNYIIKKNDFKNNTSYNYFNINNNNSIHNNENDNNNNRIKTEIIGNHNNPNLVIHRNTQHKKGNKCRLIKEFKTEKNDINLIDSKVLYFSNDNTITNNEPQKITINRNNIFYKKSQNSLRSAISGSKNLDHNDDEINIKRSNNHQLINKVSRTKNNIPFDNSNINNNFDTNHSNKEFYNDKKLPLYQDKRIIEKDNISLLRNNLVKNQSNTINNISNFNNCNYIYLFNKLYN